MLEKLPIVKVFILNTHSILNSGDAGIVLGQIQFLKKYFAKIDITLTSRTPEMDQDFYAPMGVKVLPPLFQLRALFQIVIKRFGRVSGV